MVVLLFPVLAGAQQGIVIGRNPVDDFSSTQSFTSTNLNITDPSQNDWVFDRLTPTLNPAFATRSNQQNPSNVTGFTPGIYRATVTGTGPEGSTTISLEFEILAAGGLRARFTPSQWVGIAPMTVCFTDQSVSGSPITLWEWDLDGDGSYEISGQDPGCRDYTVAGTTTLVRLRVTNANSVVQVAEQSLRTYLPFEAGQDFSIQWDTGTRFCFTPILAGATLSAWHFGDGVSDTVPNNPSCRTYGTVGTYAVDMCFVSQAAGTPGCVSRSLVVTGADAAPALVAMASCSTQANASFSVTNNGDAMSRPDQVRIINANGDLIVLAPLQLGAGQSASFTSTGWYGVLSLLTSDTAVNASTTCRPAATNVPTLSMWGILLLPMLLAGAAMLVGRRRPLGQA